MGQYTVEVSDSDGNACKIRLSLPFGKKNASPQNSTWRVLDEGLIKFRSGGCDAESSSHFFATADLLLVVSIKQGYGIKLNVFIDEWGNANDSGDGFLAQPWAVQLKPGYITWALV